MIDIQEIEIKPEDLYIAHLNEEQAEQWHKEGNEGDTVEIVTFISEDGSKEVYVPTYGVDKDGGAISRRDIDTVKVKPTFELIKKDIGNCIGAALKNSKDDLYVYVCYRYDINEVGIMADKCKMVLKSGHYEWGTNKKLKSSR